MNNRKERLEYLRRIDSDYPYNLCEEIFIISVIKNDYAMKYVEKQYNLIKDELKGDNDVFFE